MNTLKNLLFIIPLIIYYALESLFLGCVVNLTYYFLLAEKFNFYITYWQWVAVVFIIKILFFDIMKVHNNTKHNTIEESDDFIENYNNYGKI